MTHIAYKLTELKRQICECEKEFHREPGSVNLLAVAKKQSIEKIAEAIAAGQMAFGENYLQEALPKIAAFKDNQALEWHFIGPIQSNKTKKIAENFQWVHSITSEHIAKRLNDQRPSHLPPLNICLEINISEEKTKSGVNLENIFSLAEYCLSLPNLKLRGLMTIPAPLKTFEAQRAEFHKLTTLFKKMQERGFELDTLSMGMSNDWKAAISEGSTLIRIGTAIFGERI
jgi:pyridoxal phosphate enzyme (YggS family)